MPRPALAAVVAQLREASRHTVRELGLLEGVARATGCSPSQCHAMIELERRDPMTAAELAPLLRLDKSTTSRTIATLVRRGWVEVSATAGDQRRKPLRLTRTGRDRLADIHHGVDHRVAAALEQLDDDQRATVVAGMQLYASALRQSRELTAIEIRRIERRDDDAMARLVSAVMSEFLPEEIAAADPEIGALSASYDGARRAFFVAERRGELLGGAGIQPLGGDVASVCELRKMYLVPHARGLGLGRALLETCLGAAREHGFTRCYLETMTQMRQARNLYERHGFVQQDRPLGETSPSSCNTRYLLDLQTR